MAYYPDLSPCSYFGKKRADQLVAVGWLDNEHPYTKGNVSEAFVDKLIELLVDPWAPMYLLGYDECPFCGQSYSLTYKGTTIDVGARNLFLPGEGFLYVAPSLIAHYIIVHEYTPPVQFSEAVLRCPTMRSEEYFQAIVEKGPKEFADEI